MNLFLTISANDILPYIWVAFIVATAVIELITSDLVTIWFTIGAVGALIASLCKAPLWLQLIIFIVVSAACIVATRPLAKKIQKNEVIHTNSDKNIGRTALVTKAFGVDEIGEVKIDERLWRAISNESLHFEEGEKVTIKAISGTKVIVSKYNKEEEITL